MRAQARFNRQAHVSLVLVHVGVGQRCRALDEESPASLPTMSSRYVPAGRWRKCLERVKMQALTDCNANVMSTRTTVGQFKGQFKGAMDESSGKGSKMQAHPISDVVMDIAAFKVSHSVGVDKDTTALQAKKWSA